MDGEYGDFARDQLELIRSDDRITYGEWRLFDEILKRLSALERRLGSDVAHP